MTRVERGGVSIPDRHDASEHAAEIARGERFAFGENWSRFLGLLDEERIATAVSSVRTMLGVETLEGKSFLDVGCGSGLFSLAARRLGAHVLSFDYDPSSVACARHLHERYDGSSSAWRVMHGSALDKDFLETLGSFDIVYSWGVLHHTGAMWTALDNMVGMVKPGGKLFIAIYNDQGDWSVRWHAIKRHYCGSPRLWQRAIVFATLITSWWKPSLKDLLTGRPGATWRAYKKDRGMSPIHDVVDWVGGYPFEVAKPETIFDFYRERGFSLFRLKTRQNVGCNEFVFERARSFAVER
jgi:2-polyprenyl-6-hydroxyphenyl methylase/3-demethylubiquinone-9 3-methyltransferase